MTEVLRRVISKRRKWLQAETRLKREPKGCFTTECSTFTSQTSAQSTSSDCALRKRSRISLSKCPQQPHLSHKVQMILRSPARSQRARSASGSLTRPVCDLCAINLTRNRPSPRREPLENVSLCSQLYLYLEVRLTNRLLKKLL